MTATMYSARQTAREVSKRLGREVSDRRVRAWVREHVEAYDDDGYTTHAYDRRTFDRIVKGMTDGAKADRSKSAASGRKAASTPRKTRKAATSAPVEVTPDATE